MYATETMLCSIIYLVGIITFEISSAMAESLFEAGYSVKDASLALGVSESTLYRKMRQHGISKHVFNDLDDSELDEAVFKTITEFPRCGEEMLRKVLLQKDIKVWPIYIKLLIFLLAITL